MGQCFTIKEQQQDHSYRDSRVGHVKDEAEEEKLLSPDKRYPLWKVATEQRKVEHIYDLTMQKGRVSFAPRDKRGRVSRITGLEDNPIKDTVEDVPCRSRQNKRDASDEASLIMLFYQSGNIKDNKPYCHDAEKRQEQFSPRFDTEGHPVILHEIYLEPVGNMNGIIQTHMCFDPYL